VCVLLLVTFVACYPSHMHGLRNWVQVPFGKVVTCPTCKTTLAVVQPQQGVQVVPCANCRYQYELWSGTVTSCDSESISMNISAFERGLRALQLLKRPIPAAVHSIVVRICPLE
jgi:hypothetical protein